MSTFADWFDNFSGKVLHNSQSTIEKQERRKADFDQKSSELAKQLADKKITEEYYNDDMKVIKRGLRDVDRQIAIAKATQDRVKEFTSTQILNKIKSHKSVEGWSIGNDGFLNVYFQELHFKGTSQIHDTEEYLKQPIGRFRLTIHPTDMRFYCWNLTRSYGSYDHWGINGGSVCEGEWRNSLTSVLHGGKIDEFISNIILFIENAGDDGAYCSIPDWFDERYELNEENRNTRENDSVQRVRHVTGEDYYEDEDNDTDSF